MNILLLLIIIVSISLLFLSFRNDWVYKVRVKMIDDDFVKYHKLPSYDYMLFRFWVWDVNKFVKED